jgi:SOS-response transcriptional repressor LexA
MDKIISSIKERILQIPEIKGIKKDNFFQNIGMTYGNFKGEQKKRPINSDTLAIILSDYPDINPKWLLTGQGEMVVGNNPIPLAISTINGDGIPLIPAYALAGVFSGEINVLELECERFVVPVFKGAEFLIQVKGSSMYPKYNSGDIVACKKLPLDTFFQWNKVYVLDTDQGALIKRVKKASKVNFILIVSDNEKYDSFELSIKCVYSIAIVMGVIRLE